MKKVNVLMLALAGVVLSLTACNSGTGATTPLIANGSYNFDQTQVTLTGTLPSGVESCANISFFTSTPDTAGIYPITATKGTLSPTESDVTLTMQNTTANCLDFVKTKFQGPSLVDVEYQWNNCQYNESAGVLTANQVFNSVSNVPGNEYRFTCNGPITLTLESASGG